MPTLVGMSVRSDIIAASYAVAVVFVVMVVKLLLRWWVGRGGSATRRDFDNAGRQNKSCSNRTKTTSLDA